jgi:3',5'-cyclic AMP phosphodiesterase CpdA
MIQRISKIEMNTMTLIAEDNLSNPQRKNSDKTAIVHLSDLHFKPDFDEKTNSNLSNLRKDIIGYSPDAIIITGDIVNNSFLLSLYELTKEALSLKSKIDRLKRLKERFRSKFRDRIYSDLVASYSNAKDFIFRLCEDCEIDRNYGLFIVPGNHDYRLEGIISDKVSLDIFNQELGNYFISRPIPSLGVVICSFNSNVENDNSLNFATGYVNEAEITDFFSNEFSLWKGKKDGTNENMIDFFENLTKIAILHHHPMPIPEVQTRDLTKREEFLLLKNSGVFMKEMINNDIDIILHGHRHFPSYSRASFTDDENFLHDIGVVAAGAAGSDDPHFSYNRIKIKSDGMIEVEHRKRYTGSYDKLKPKFFLLPYEKLRTQKRRKLIKEKEIKTSMSKLIFDCNILESGDADISVKFLKWRSLTGSKIYSINSELNFTKASMPQPSIFDENKQVSITKIDETEDEIIGQININGGLDKNPIDAVFELPISNSFFFDERDLKAITKSGKYKLDRDIFHSRMRYDADLLEGCIKFPPKFIPRDPIINAYSDFSATILDSQESNYCNNYYSYHELTNCVTFSISDPLPGYCYEIQWALPSEDYDLVHLSPKEKRFVNEIRRMLLSNDEEIIEKINTKILDFKEELLQHDSFVKHYGNNIFEINFFVFDNENRIVKNLAVAPCENTGYTDGGQPWQKQYLIGEGVSGQAIKRKEAVLFSEVLNQNSKFGKYKFGDVCGNAESKFYRGIYSIPLLFPPPPQKYGARIGTLSFKTCANKSVLLSILETQEGIKNLTVEAIKFYKRKLLPSIGIDLRKIMEEKHD